MNREEWTTWAKSLNPGDSVIVRSWSDISIDTVKRVTPAGWVVTEGSGTYAKSQYSDRYNQRGGFNHIEPATEDLREKAFAAMAEKEKNRKISRTINAAKNIAYDWLYGTRNVDYDLACKILSLAGVEVKDQ